MYFKFLDEDLCTAISTLADHYTRKETVPLEYVYDWPTSCVKYYVPLTIFCYEENYTKSDATAVARMLMLTETVTNKDHSSTSIHSKTTENVSNLLASFEKFSFPYVILIEGAAGIGKSTLCKEIALQWANKCILKKGKLLFLLFMHNPIIKRLSDVELLVKHFFQNETLASKITDWLLATDGKYLTIIVDGYSEDSRNCFIADAIINRKMLTQCRLIITSRLAASSYLSKIVNVRAVILGFTKNNQIAFIENALRGLNSKKYNHLKDHLHSFPIIESFCHIPLIMNMLFEEGINNLPKTWTSLIQKYIMTIVTKTKSITDLRLLPHPYDQIIKDLSKLAFIAIQKNQLTFTVNEILESCINELQIYWQRLDFSSKILKLGLINRISFHAQNTDFEIFHFNHVKIQEYLAAFYIASIPGDELFNLLHSSFWNICYLNVWIMYIDISESKSSVFKNFLSGIQPFGTSVKTISNCLKLADGDFDNKLLGQNIDLKHQKLLHSHLHTLAVLLLQSTNKQWKDLNLSSCDIDNEGCTILYKILYSSTEFNFETIDISYNNFHWESFNKICNMLKPWHTKKLVFSIDTVYDTVTMNMIINFTATLNETFQNDIFSDEVLLLTYLAKQSTLIAVYSAPTYIRWSQWTNCKLNEDIIEQIRLFMEAKVRNKSFKIAFAYRIDYNVGLTLSSLLSDIQSIQLSGSYLHSKGAYLLNVASTFDCQYNSPQELVADYLAAVLSHNAQSTTPYLESLPAAYATAVKTSLRSTLSLSVFDISNNSISNQIATEISVVLSFTSTLHKFYASDDNLLAENTIMIAKSLQNITTLAVFNISSNNIGEEAADDIATVLSHNTQLQGLHLNNNSFKTEGMIKIAKALQNTKTLTVFNISSNNVDKKAAGDIAKVLSHNTKLERLHFNNNNFETEGMIKIAKALQNITTLTVLNISSNNIGEEAADDIAKVLSHNTQLQGLHLSNNSFKTEGMIEIAKALQNITTLTVFNISSNNVDKEAAGDIAKVLSHNLKLQRLHFSNNNFETTAMTMLAKALHNISTLTILNISSNHVSEEAADDIAEVISCNIHLQELYLGNNSFKAVGMIKIVKALQNISNLTVLNISNNNISEEAADDIVIAISQNTQLRELHLHNNKFQTVGAIKITKALKNILTLAKYNISGNEIEGKTVNILRNILSQNTKLKLHI